MPYRPLKVASWSAASSSSLRIASASATMTLGSALADGSDARVERVLPSLEHVEERRACSGWAYTEPQVPCSLMSGVRRGLRA